MKIGVLTVLYADLSLEQALDKIKALGVGAVEFGAAAYGGTAHCDASRVVADDAYADELKRTLAERELELSAISVHGNPLHPDPAIAHEHDQALRNGVQAAVKLGVETVNCFSGCPGDRAGGSTPNWVTCPWPPEYLELWEWQWEQSAIPYWKDAARYAEEHGVRFGFEMHPGMIVYNPATLLRLRDEAGPAIGANFDPSHLVWQGIDVRQAIRELGAQDAIYHVHAKDTSVDRANVARNGNIDPKPYTDLANRAWTFRTVGYGGGESFWKEFVSELRVAGFDGVLSIEHEDMLASVDEGLARAVEMLERCVLSEPPATPWWI